MKKQQLANETSHEISKGMFATSKMPFAVTTLRPILQTLSFTLKYLLGRTERHKEITEEYPDRVSSRMAEDLPNSFRGLLKNEVEKCTGCGDCVAACPVSCIGLQTEPGPQSDRKWIAEFRVDHSRCFFCGACVSVCPTKSLTHTKEYELAVGNASELILNFGKGWADESLKSRWLRDQKDRNQQVEDRKQQWESPVSSELKKLLKGQSKL